MSNILLNLLNGAVKASTAYGTGKMQEQEREDELRRKNDADERQRQVDQAMIDLHKANSGEARARMKKLLEPFDPETDDQTQRELYVAKNKPTPTPVKHLELRETAGNMVYFDPETGDITTAVGPDGKPVQSYHPPREPKSDATSLSTRRQLATEATNAIQKVPKPFDTTDMDQVQKYHQDINSILSMYSFGSQADLANEMKALRNGGTAPSAPQQQLQGLMEPIQPAKAPATASVPPSIASVTLQLRAKGLSDDQVVAELKRRGLVK